MEIIIDPRLPETGKRLLECLKKQEITLQEFLTECAYWSLKDGFQELTPKQYPSHKPEKVIELEQKTIEQRNAMNWHRLFIDYPQVEQYYKAYWFVKHINFANLSWLQEILSYIPEDDTLSRKRIENRILDFNMIEDGLDKEAEIAKQTFGATETRRQDE